MLTISRACSPSPFDLVFMANAFRGVPDPARLAMAVKAVLKPDGRFTIVNWHARPREGTTILGEPRTEDGIAIDTGKDDRGRQDGRLKFLTLVEIPPYRYGAIFERSPT